MTVHLVDSHGHSNPVFIRHALGRVWGQENQNIDEKNIFMCTWKVAQPPDERMSSPPPKTCSVTQKHSIP